MLVIIILNVIILLAIIILNVIILLGSVNSMLSQGTVGAGRLNDQFHSSPGPADSPGECP